MSSVYPITTDGKRLLRLMSLREAADLLGLSIPHLRREIRLRKLACHRFGRLIRISEDDLEAYLSKRRRGAR